jgi:uncharacterized repeat protein (TIGR01451 family)
MKRLSSAVALVLAALLPALFPDPAFAQGPLVNGQTHVGAISSAGEADGWTFAAAAGAAILIRAGEIGGDSDFYPWLRLLGPNGVLVDGAAGPHAVEVGLFAPLAGTYTLLVASNDSGQDATGDYTVTLALVPGGTPVVSAGDQGGALTTGANHAGAIHVGDLDQWTFTAAAGAAMIVRIGEVGGDSDLYPWLRVYGPNGASVVGSAGPHAAEVAAFLPQDGTYTVVVATNDSGFDAAGDYLLTLALVPGSPAVSPGDQGGALTNGAVDGGAIHVGDLDQWTFTAAAGSAILIRIGEIGGDSDLYPWMRLYGPNGAFVDGSAGPHAAEVGAFAPLTGTYTLVVATNDSGYDAIGDYQITLALVPGSPTVSPGDHGGPVTNGVNHTGEIHVGDLDQWTFLGVSGTSIQINAGEIGGDSDLYPWIRVYGPNGAAVRSTSAPEALSTSFTAPLSGTYTVVVATNDSGYDATGDYRLQVTGVATSTDLQITKAVSAPSAARGASISFVLVATNGGPQPAANVVISDAVPASLAITSCTASGGASCAASGNTRTVTYTSLAPGATQTVTIATTVNAQAGTTLVNTATIAANAVDGVPANDSASASFVVVGAITPTDSDGDGLETEWETRFGLDPNAPGGDSGAGGDPDGDGIPNLDEQAGDTHPRGFFTPLLAEGAQNAFFDVRLALLNVSARAARILIRHLQPGGTVVTRYTVLEPGRRLTLGRDELTGLTSPDFSTVVESDEPVVLDRTMTWGGGYGSHAETGVADASTTWYLAEGSTSGEFALFYLLQNPTATATVATIRYLLPLGQAPIERTYSLPPNSRTTIPVDDQGGILASSDVSAVITASVPIVVERAMYRSTPTQVFAAGHNSAGVTAPATSWFLAEGATGPFFDCFILLANPNDQATTATIDYLLSDGRTFSKPYALPANGRVTVWIDSEQIPAGSGIRPLDNVAVSSTVTAPIPIIVERTMWCPSPTTSSDFWTEAHNSPGATVTGTRWALAEGEVGGPQGAETYILIANTSAAAGTARVTLYFEDGTNVVRTFDLLPRSRRTVNASVDFPAAAGRRFGALVESLGAPAAQIVVERAMYTSPGGAIWTAGTNALGARVP